jgi:chromosomal replication initiator protein
MVADITPPDFETRVAIIEQKLKMTGEKRDKDIIELLAHAITDNIREIE